MKKVNSILSVALMLVCCIVLSLGAISCEKEATECRCTITSSMVGDIAKTKDYPIPEAGCSSLNETYSGLGLTTTTTCEEL